MILNLEKHNKIGGLLNLHFLNHVRIYVDYPQWERFDGNITNRVAEIIFAKSPGIHRKPEENGKTKEIPNFEIYWLKHILTIGLL